MGVRAPGALYDCSLSRSFSIMSVSVSIFLSISTSAVTRCRVSVSSFSTVSSFFFVRSCDSWTGSMHLQLYLV